MTCLLLGNTNNGLAIPLLDAVFFISFSVQCLFCRYDTDKDVCSLLPWDLSCLFIGPTGTATMAPDINQARRRCSVLSCRTPKGVTHTHADHKETDCGWWRTWQGQHLCDKALTVSLFSLQPASWTLLKQIPANPSGIRADYGTLSQKQQAGEDCGCGASNMLIMWANWQIKILSCNWTETRAAAVMKMTLN